MEKGFKFFLYAFVVILAGSIFFLEVSPIAEENKWKQLVSIVNAELPKEIGTIGYLDSITYENRTIYYMVSVNGDSRISQVYTDNYDDFSEMLKYSILTMNGQHNMADLFANILANDDMNIAVRYYAPDKTFTEWKFSGKELKDFVDYCKISPTEALYKVIDMQVKIANLSLPMKPHDSSSVRSVVINSIESADEDCLLQSISHTGDDIIFEYKVDERKDWDLNMIQKNSANEVFIENMASMMEEDADAKEFLGLIAIAHSNLVIKYIDLRSNKRAEVTIPYHVLRRHCSVPTFLLSDY